MRDEPQNGITASGGSDTGLFSGIVWTLVLFFVVYPLSVAPAAKIFGPTPPASVRLIYAPLGYLHDHLQPVHSFYDWYANVWGVHL
jgi:hypothetical protein